jgi:hypothetical protein
VTEDPYLVKILKKHYKDTEQDEAPLYNEIKGSYFFAKTKDKFGEYHYLSADSEEAIEKYCEGGIISDSMAIDKWATYVDPILVATHFKWVGRARNPFRISKYHDYENPTAKPKEKW